MLADANRDTLVGHDSIGRHLKELAAPLADGEISVEVNRHALYYSDEVLLAAVRLLNRCRLDVDLAEDVSRILGAPERLSLLEALCTSRDATSLARAQVTVGEDILLTEQRLDEAVSHRRAHVPTDLLDDFGWSRF